MQVKSLVQLTLDRITSFSSSSDVAVLNKEEVVSCTWQPFILSKCLF